MEHGWLEAHAQLRGRTRLAELGSKLVARGLVVEVRALDRLGHVETARNRPDLTVDGVTIDPGGDHRKLLAQPIPIERHARLHDLAVRQGPEHGHRLVGRRATATDGKRRVEHGVDVRPATDVGIGDLFGRRPDRQDELALPI